MTETESRAIIVEDLQQAFKILTVRIQPHTIRCPSFGSSRGGPVVFVFQDASRGSPHFRRRVSLTSAALVLAAGVLVAGPVPPGPAEAAPDATASTEDMRDEITILADASAEAARAGQPVEVTQRRTEDSRLLANPSGSFSTESFAHPIHVQRAGDWVDIDATLRMNADGSISPTATPGSLTISGGGSGPLLTVGKDDKNLSLTWPTPLPAPSLQGNTATYPNVLPEVDLQVTAEPMGGYREQLVVKSPTAADNPALHAITFGVRTDGLTLSTRTDGGINALDSTGAAVFATDPPLMWDTPSEPTLSRIERIEGNGPIDSDPQSRLVGPMDVVLTPTAITVIPDRDILDNPQVNWPLFLDPNSTPIGPSDWTHIAKEFPTQSYWNYDRDDGAKVGAASGVTYRSYFLFGIGNIRGKIITSATFGITLDHSYQCSTNTPVDLYLTDNISRSGAVTWKNSVTDTNKWRSNLASASGHANESSCGEPDMPMGFASTALTNAVSTAAAGTSSQITFGLRAPNEGTNQQWKKFHPGTAKLTVEWNTAPAVPTELTTYPPIPCGSSTNPTRLSESMKNPTFTAGLSDADANNLTAYLEIRRASGDVLVHGPAASATIPAGGVVTWPTVPDGVLVSNETVYYYQARAKDTGGAFGSFTARCYFLVDGNDPGQPTITSTDYPAGSESVNAGSVGTVTISPAAGDIDIAGYRYGFDDNVKLWAPADATGKATIPITLWGDPDFPGTAIADLWMKAVDKAGNERLEVTGPRTLAAGGTATVADKHNDINGDGKADVATVLDMGNGRTAAWTMMSSGGGFHPATIAWDSGVNGGHAIDRIQTAGGDFDNDGRTDIAVFRQDPDGHVRLFNLRSDTNQYQTDWASVDVGTWLLGDARVFADDFTGDGIDDAAAVVDDRAGGWRAYVYPSTGTAFTTSGTPWYTQSPGTYTWINTKTVAGDFTGDGKADLAVAQDTTGARTTVRVHASNGTGFSAGTSWWDSDTDTDPTTFTGNAAKYTAINVNGTGATDLVALYNHGAKTTIKVLTANGSTFAGPATWWDSDVDSVDGWDWRRTIQVTTGDFDNDGDNDLAAIVDCCEAGNRELWTFPHNGTSFGQVTKKGNATATTTRTGTAHWRFDDGSGTTLADAYGNYPASVAGPTWNTNGHVIGDKALHFDGTNDYVTTGRPVIDTSRSYTVAAWVKLDNTTAYRTFISQTGTHRSGFYLQYNKPMNAWTIIAASADTTGSVNYYAARDFAPPRLGVWTHLVGVYDADANQLKLYINGALRGSSSQPSAWNATRAFQIGNATSGQASGDWVAGDIDDVRVYDLALTSPEIGQLARDTALAGQWKFDNPTGATTDSSGNNRNLTLNSTTTGTTGKYGQAITLNGTTSYASAARSVDTLTGYTACAWAKIDNVAGLAYRAVLSQQATRSSGFWIRTSPTNRWQFVTAFSDSGYSAVEAPTTVSVNTWTHLCATWDPGTSQMILFVDGKLAAAATISSPPIQATGPINIGSYKYLDVLGGYFPGAIDDVRIYSGAILDTKQIEAIMNDK
ncbi:LamG-like jellyroll fold domain-containing protein [Micromonospora sp. NPDC004704]